MQRDTEPMLWTPERLEVEDLDDVLVKMQCSGNFFFLKSLKRSHVAVGKIHSRSNSKMAIPSEFVREHGFKIEEWSIIRVRESDGFFSRPWVVRLSIVWGSPKHAVVRFSGIGWNDFVRDNRLQMGDSLIFVLKGGVRSEFEAYCFRGNSGLAPYFPDLDEDSRDGVKTEDENRDGGNKTFEEEKGRRGSVSASKKNVKQPPAPPQMHQKAENKDDFSTHGNAVKRTAFHHANDLKNRDQCPGFLATLAASHIHRRHQNSLGRFEFPTGFANTDGRHLQSRVQLQGVREDSPVHVAACGRRKKLKKGKFTRIFLNSRDWSEFVRKNGLKKGDHLQFSLCGDSFFKIRKV